MTKSPAQDPDSRSRAESRSEADPRLDTETRIDARIDARYGSLPPQERHVADFLLEHLGDLAIFSAADISRETGVSKATVSRLFRKLDFEDFREVKDHARALRSRGVPTAAPVTSADNDASTGVQRHEARDHENLARLGAGLAEGRLQQAVEMLAAAERVIVLGLRNSYPVALHLHQQLIQTRSKVRLAPQPGQTLGEELAGIGSGDLVVAVGFRRRPVVFGRAVRAVAASPAQLLCLGDSTSRHYAMEADCWIECPIDSEGAFDSYAAAMSLVSLLANGVLNRQLGAGRRRLSAIAKAYDELEELEH
ncbi:RpiR family transcriptional regulator [Nesterenkonia sp. AN1]|uniref:MurR/RpiR family transcriptional regulator n=1 Tax=Nesterenkonia sp. AN1 TaxID=652017 RepID=UPI000446064D|nr:MurR/RpiR family transcriptional regulator [Nesterenkonia sp. AN1]EXF25679.1 RpiR family transcriptional regulator [Nesterenkonia sp. AN1]